MDTLREMVGVGGTKQNNTERDMDTLNVNTIHLKCSGKVAETSVSHMLTSGAGAGFRMC